MSASSAQPWFDPRSPAHQEPADWLDELPLAYADQIARPVQFEAFVDAPAHARMVVGRDDAGQRCFMQHSHTVIELRFDVDEWPVEVPVCREFRTAWRLREGGWLCLLDQIDRLESCASRHQRTGPLWQPTLPAGW